MPAQNAASGCARQRRAASHGLQHLDLRVAPGPARRPRRHAPTRAALRACRRRRGRRACGRRGRAGRRRRGSRGSGAIEKARDAVRGARPRAVAARPRGARGDARGARRSAARGLLGRRDAALMRRPVLAACPSRPRPPRTSPARDLGAEQHARDARARVRPAAREVQAGAPAVAVRRAEVGRLLQRRLEREGVAPTAPRSRAKSHGVIRCSTATRSREPVEPEARLEVGEQRVAQPRPPRGPSRSRRAGSGPAAGSASESPPGAPSRLRARGRVHVGGEGRGSSRPRVTVADEVAVAGPTSSVWCSSASKRRSVPR
jgi:hypothetical protein